MNRLLRQISVLDMTEGVAGPCAASLLGDMGASVIKVERPEGDWGRGSEDPLRPYFVANNRNKRDLCLNLQKEEANPVVRRLVERSDVVLSNYRKGVMERLGVGYEACQKIKPGIIYCTISAFGQKGSYASLPASDTGMQAISGIMDSIGEMEGLPLRVSFPLVDIFSASMAVQGILLALYARQQGKLGTRIDISLLNAALSLQAMPFTSFLMTAELPKRYGNQNPTLSPAGAYRTKDDKYMTIAILGESYWERFCQAIGMEKISKEEMFKNNFHRVKNRAALNDILAPIFLGKTRGEWIHTFKEADILCSPLNTFTDVLDDSALVESISLWKFKLKDKEIRMMGNPIEIDGEYLTLELPPPLKGEHTIAILDELGYGHSEIQVMLSQGVVYSLSTL
ncbi:MAG: CoA transferase [Deltaproteobacteria bacterium]|nr:CoA transferase [Deltaproteobacteria bacterium]